MKEAGPIESLAATVMGDREPASIARQLRSTEIIDLPCEQMSNQEISVKALQVRLHGSLCRNPIEISSIENKTTGKSITLFVKHKQYSTDYIQLQSGKNQIVVEYRENNQIKQKDITLVQ